MQPDQPETPASEAALPTAAAPLSATPGTPEVAAEESDVEIIDTEPGSGSQLPVARPLPMDELASAVKKYRGSSRAPERLKFYVRAFLLMLAVGFMAVFACAIRIYPYDADGNPQTMATHTQLGMPPCNFSTMTGKPCPSCGMTTSFALLVRGDVLSSLRANWVGSCICVLWAVTMVWALASSLWGKLLIIPPGRTELVFTVIVGAMVVLMLTRWTVILVQ